MRARRPCRRAQIACGVLAGPVFASVFTALGARRAGYDWRRHAVSTLAIGREGWPQRANFVLAGALYGVAGHGLARVPRRVAGPRAVGVLIGGAGVGLIGSGAFVTDPAGGFPPAPGPTPATRAGRLHNLFAVPIFAGIPLAALVCAASAARRREHRWAACSATAGAAMLAAFALFGAALGGAAPRLGGLGGVFQRLSIACGFGWISALSLRALAGPTEARGGPPAD